MSAQTARDTPLSAAPDVSRRGHTIVLPGQTWDLAVKQAAGSYYFQCDPHAALGMKGHLVVE